MKRLVVASLLLSVVGCRTEEIWKRPQPSFERMLEQPRYDAYESSTFFEDGMAMRRPPEGALPYRPTPLDPRLETGREADASFVAEVPLGLSVAFLQRGRQAFRRSCAACHGALGDGDTVVAEHMARKPPSLHERRIREKPVGELFAVASEGFGLMPSLESQLDVRERWAVVAYVRALQRSQHAPLAELPADVRSELRRRAP